ncbi:MAG: hypothetical protein NW207_09630 [Cytophagales bacterium]|nr:hypothetical protein [Cytophagales bacterium]
MKPNLFTFAIILSASMAMRAQTTETYLATGSPVVHHVSTVVSSLSCTQNFYTMGYRRTNVVVINYLIVKFPLNITQAPVTIAGPPHFIQPFVPGQFEITTVISTVTRHFSSGTVTGTPNSSSPCSAPDVITYSDAYNMTNDADLTYSNTLSSITKFVNIENFTFTGFTTCKNQPVTLNTMYPQAGLTFSGLGVSGNTFTPAQIAGSSSVITIRKSYINGMMVKTVTAALNDTLITTAFQPLQTICGNATTYDLKNTVLPQYINSSSIFTINASTTLGMINITPSSTGIIWPVLYTYNNTTTGCKSKKTGQVFQSPNLAVTAGAAQTLCANLTETTLTGYVPQVGTFAGIGISTANNKVYSVPGVGMYVLTFNHRDAYSCTYRAYKTITVHGSNYLKDTTAQLWTPLPTVCGNGTINLQSYLTQGASTTTGTFASYEPLLQNAVSSPYLNANSIYSSSGGTYKVHYTYADETDGCKIRSYNDVAVHPYLFGLTVGPNLTVCAGIPTTITGPMPLGGTFTGVGILSAQGAYYTTLLGMRFVDYNIYDSYGCLYNRTKPIMVVSATSVNAGVVYTVCGNDNTLSLNDNSVSPLGGVWTGSLVSGGTFNPRLSPDSAGIKKYILQYTYTNTLTGCISKAEKDIFVKPYPKLAGNIGFSILCNEKIGTLSIKSPQAGHSYKWYSTAGATVPVFTGSTYLTPQLLSETSFYVDAQNEYNCISNRENVTATLKSSTLPAEHTGFTVPTNSGTHDLNAMGTAAGLTALTGGAPIAATGIGIVNGTVTAPQIVATVQIAFNYSNAQGCPSVINSKIAFTDSPVTDIYGDDTSLSWQLISRTGTDGKPTASTLPGMYIEIYSNGKKYKTVKKVIVE